MLRVDHVVVEECDFGGYEYDECGCRDYLCDGVGVDGDWLRCECDDYWDF